MDRKQIVLEIRHKMKEIRVLEEEGIDNYLYLLSGYPEMKTTSESLMKEAILPIIDKIENKNDEILKLLDEVKSPLELVLNTPMQDITENRWKDEPQEFIISRVSNGISISEMLILVSGFSIYNAVVHGDNGSFHITCKPSEMERILDSGWSIDMQTSQKKLIPIDSMVMAAILP